jgi:hypothetical protein
MKNVLIFLLIIISFNEIKAQLLKLGFRYEPALVLTKENNNSDYEISAYSFYLTTSITPIENLSIDLRPGYFFGHEYYGGFEIGVYAKWVIQNSKYFLVVGLNKHSNSWLGSHNGGSGISKDMIYKAFGLGFQSNSKISFDIMYYWTNNKIFSYSRYYYYTSNGEVYGTSYNEITGILKVSFSCSFDII